MAAQTSSGLEKLEEACLSRDVIIVDDGCTESIGGSSWLAKHEARFTALKKHPCSRSFGFGGNTSKTAKFYVFVPMKVGNHKVSLKLFIVPGILPPLFSKASLKKLRVVMNYGEDSAIGYVGGPEPIPLALTTGPSGHYNLELRSRDFALKA
jgi:hypothetical protein